MLNDRKLLSTSIDLLKGIAIIGVVMFHFYGDHAYKLLQMPMMSDIDRIGSYLIQFTHIGSQGIHVFFFLSGFGIALSERAKLLPAKAFFSRRMSRLFPEYIVAILVVIVLLVATGQILLDDALLRDIFVSLLLIRNYSSEWIREINGNWWFVSAIVPMYFLHLLSRKYIYLSPAKALLLAYGTSLSYKLILAYLCSVAVLDFDAGRLNPYTAFFLNYWWEFVAGIVCVRLDCWGKLCAAKDAWLLCLLLCGIAFEVTGIIGGSSAFGRLVNDDFFAVAQILIWSSLVLLAYRRGVLNFKWVGALKWLGGASYSIYLVHHPISKTLLFFGITGYSLLNITALFVVYFIGCVLAGLLVKTLADKFFDGLLSPKAGVSTQ